MPQMDGFEVCKRLKLDEGTRRIPVIFISTVDEVASKVEGFTSGGVDYITKPFEAEEVLARVKTHLSLSQMQKQLELQNDQLRQEISERTQAEEGLKTKTAFFEALTNASPDGILVVNENQTRILTNRRLIELFDVPQNIIDDEDDALMLEHTVSLTKYPEQVIKKIKYLYDHVKETGRDEIELKSGRVLDRHSAPVMDKEGKYYGRIWTFRDITERKEAERKLQEANEKLSSSVKDLEATTAEMKQLSEMGEQLQSCQTVEEASAISAQYIQRLCPDSQGALYLISSSRDLADAVNMWGDPASTEKMFMPLNCWAIRRGRPHLVDSSHPGVLCGHITGPQAGQYLCVPMMSHGEALGILHLNHTTPAQAQQKSTDRLYNEHKTQLVLAAAEHIALAIGNLKLRETLRQQAIRDILTGLFNRRYMEESLARELRRAQREKKPVGVIMFDIDHFKNFNDLFGHDGGDALLRELGAFLKKRIRGGDIISRYGGEEFVYVLPGAVLEDARLRAEEMRQGVKELLVYHLGKPLGKITISFGVAAFPEHGLTSEEILKSADIALYRAKSEGRDRVVVASAIGKPN
jgi:diguanylate cyclase (GGDEF)-like protein